MGEVEIPSREWTLEAQRVKDWVSKLWGCGSNSHQADSVGAHYWRVPNRTKQLSSAPASLLTIQNGGNCNQTIQTWSWHTKEVGTQTSIFVTWFFLWIINTPYFRSDIAWFYICFPLFWLSTLMYYNFTQ